MVLFLTFLDKAVYIGKTILSLKIEHYRLAMYVLIKSTRSRTTESR